MEWQKKTGENQVRTITEREGKCMDYRSVANDIYKCIGGRENIVSAAHCATRLRLVIADNAKCSKKELENIDGVKGVFEASGQLQIILGTGTVNKVYDEFIAIAGITAATKEEVKQAATAKQNIFKRMIKTLGDVFVPIIPAIVASGLLMGLLEGLSKMFPAMANSGSYTIIHLFSNAAFVFLPILIGISAARVFGGNIFLGGKWRARRGKNTDHNAVWYRLRACGSGLRADCCGWCTSYVQCAGSRDAQRGRT